MPIHIELLPKSWIFLFYIFILISFHQSTSYQLTACFPPKKPIGGSYEPSKTMFTPGDVLRYSCGVDREMFGNVKIMCTDSGDWTGETPHCGKPAVLKSEPTYSSSRGLEGAIEVTDGDPLTCSGRAPGKKEWNFAFEKRSSVLAVRLIRSGGVARVQVADSYGILRSCEPGSHAVSIDSHKWKLFYCPAKANGMSLKITESNEQSGNLLLCEVKISLEQDESDTVCPPLPLNETNGKWLINGDDPRMLNVGSEAQLTCNFGYLMVGFPETVLCLSEGKWSPSSAVCKKIEDADDLKKETLDEKKVKTIALGVCAFIIFIWILASIFCICKQCQKSKANDGRGVQLNDNPSFVASLEDRMYH